MTERARDRRRRPCPRRRSPRAGPAAHPGPARRDPRRRLVLPGLGHPEPHPAQLVPAGRRQRPVRRVRVRARPGRVLVLAAGPGPARDPDHDGPGGGPEAARGRLDRRRHDHRAWSGCGACSGSATPRGWSARPLPGPLRLVLGLVCTVVVFVLVILVVRGLRALVRRGSRLGQRFLRPWVGDRRSPRCWSAVCWCWCCHQLGALPAGAGLHGGKALALNSRTPDGPDRADLGPALGQPGLGRVVVVAGPQRPRRSSPTGRRRPRSRPRPEGAGAGADPGLRRAVRRPVDRPGRRRRRRRAAADRRVRPLGAGADDDDRPRLGGRVVGLLDRVPHRRRLRVAAMQYSYLPSPVALLSDRRTPAQSPVARC